MWKKSKKDETNLKNALYLYMLAPRTTSRGYGKASKAIEDGEPFFTKDSLNKILPVDLQEE